MSLKTFLPKGSFVRNVFTLMSGATIAQVIPIAIAPILTRLYSPSDFGIIMLYMSIAGIVSVVATGRYELAIMLPKSDDDAINIAVLAIFIAISISFTTFFVVWLFKDHITLLLNNQEISNWLYFIPLTIMLTSLYSILHLWCNRKKKYKGLAVSNIAQSATRAANNVLMGFMGMGSTGLFVGNFAGQGVANSVLGWNVCKDIKEKIKLVERHKIKIQAHKYIRFPQFDIPSALCYVFSTNGINILLSSFYGSTPLGFISLANRIITTPFSLFTTSFSQVFYQKLSETYNNRRDKFGILISISMQKLCRTLTIPFFLIVISTKYIALAVFGENWSELYRYIFILSPFLFVGLITAPLGNVLKILNKQHISLICWILNLFIRFTALFVSYKIFNDIYHSLFCYSIASTAMTFVNIFVVCCVGKIKMPFEMYLIFGLVVMIYILLGLLLGVA